VQKSLAVRNYSVFLWHISTQKMCSKKTLVYLLHFFGVKSPPNKQIHKSANQQKRTWHAASLLSLLVGSAALVIQNALGIA